MLNEKDMRAVSELADEKISASEKRISKMIDDRISASERRMQVLIENGGAQVRSRDGSPGRHPRAARTALSC